MFLVAHWSIFYEDYFKGPDNFNIKVISVLESVGFFFFIWVEILVLGMMSNFQLYSKHLGYYVMRLWSYLNFLFLLASSVTRVVVEKRDHLVTSRWEWRSRFPTWPLLTAWRVGCLVTLGWKKVQAPISPSPILPWWEGEECLLQLGKCRSLAFPFGLCWWV